MYGILNPAAGWAFGPEKDDPVVVADVQKYVAAAGIRPSPGMVGMAFPGTFMLDRRGRVTSRFFEDFYVDRNTTSSVMMRLGSGTPPVAAAKISTAQLEITTFPSDAEVTVGNRFSLAFEVSPHAGIHVYAPGASGYRPIAVTIDPLPFVQLRPLQYPSSQILLLQAAQRARSRLPEAVPIGSGSPHRRNDAGAESVSGQGIADPQRHRRIPSLRRQGLLQSCHGSSDVDESDVATAGALTPARPAVGTSAVSDTTGHGTLPSPRSAGPGSHAWFAVSDPRSD